MDTFESAARSEDGRFTPGHSGNPAGKKPGTRNRASILREALREGEGTTVARVVIDKALGGDKVLACFLMKELSPRPRGHFVEFELPEGAERDPAAVFDCALRALAAGEIAVEAAIGIARFLEIRQRVLKAGSGAAAEEGFNFVEILKEVEATAGPQEAAARKAAEEAAARAAGGVPSEPDGLQTPGNSQGGTASAPTHAESGSEAAARPAAGGASEPDSLQTPRNSQDAAPPGLAPTPAANPADAATAAGEKPESAQQTPNKSLTAITRGWRGKERYRIKKRRRPHGTTWMSA